MNTIPDELGKEYPQRALEQPQNTSNFDMTRMAPVYAGPDTMSSQEKPIICETCGANNPANAKFCIDCGARFQVK